MDPTNVIVLCIVSVLFGAMLSGYFWERVSRKIVDREVARIHASLDEAAAAAQDDFERIMRRAQRRQRRLEEEE